MFKLTISGHCVVLVITRHLILPNYPYNAPLTCIFNDKNRIARIGREGTGIPERARLTGENLNLKSSIYCCLAHYCSTDRPS